MIRIKKNTWNSPKKMHVYSLWGKARCCCQGWARVVLLPSPLLPMLHEDIWLPCWKKTRLCCYSWKEIDQHSTARKNVMFKNVLISSETRALCQYLHVITKSHFHEIEFVSKKRNSFTRKANWQAPNLRYTLSHRALYSALWSISFCGFSTKGKYFQLCWKSLRVKIPSDVMDEKQEIAGKVARPVFDVKRQTKPCRKKGSIR